MYVSRRLRCLLWCELVDRNATEVVVHARFHADIKKDVVNVCQIRKLVLNIRETISQKKRGGGGDERVKIEREKKMKSTKGKMKGIHTGHCFLSAKISSINFPWVG